ncbi:hypothetical protein LCGC14_3159240, partial [marine sediment metagenome]
EEQLRHEGHDVQVIIRGEDVPSIDPRRKTVVKLHGDVDSPSSLVITSGDYSAYESGRQPLLELLRGELTRNTLLFLGTSFRDPRLWAADDEIIRRFGDLRRPPYILLATPSARPAVREDDEAARIAQSDFKAFCEELEERDYHVVVLEGFEQAAAWLRKISREFQGARAGGTASISDRILAADRVELRRDLRNLHERHCKKEIDEIRGTDERPAVVPHIAVQRAEALMDYVDENVSHLSPAVQVNVWSTVSDTFMAPLTDRLPDARRCYERGLAAADELPSDDEERRRLGRVGARLHLLEGDAGQAIAALDHEADPKAARLWLWMLLDLGREEEA